MNYKQQLIAIGGLAGSAISAITMVKSGVYKGTFYH